MRLLSKIVWSEGMHLSPQHFQAQSRYFEDCVHFATTSLWNEAYGFVACEIDSDSLRNGILALLHARGLFPDGLAFDMPECDLLPEPRDITELFPPTADHVTFNLTIPRLAPDGKNCELDSTLDLTTRYIGSMQTLADENTGRDDKPI